MKFSVLALLVLLMVGCGRVPEPPARSGELIVATVNGPTSFYLDTDDEPAGFEHDLAKAFAEQQGWSVRFVIADSLDDARAQVVRGQAHIAAAGLTWGKDQIGGIRYGAVYETLPVFMVCGEGIALPGPDALGKLRIEVSEDGDDADRMRVLQRKVPGMRVATMRDLGRGELLGRVANGLSDCTLADQRSLAIAKNYHPGLREVFTVGPPRQLAWVISPHLDGVFVQKVRDFFPAAEKKGLLAQLRERYFAHVERLNPADVLGLLRLRTQRLPALKVFFQEAEQITGIDWRFLAAVAYQESQWDRHARSSTSVRGIMMLTEETADHLGVTDRTDPRQSILGGARYLAQLKERLPESIQDPDRTWMALAAYNIGPSHLGDAMRLARRMGRDPYVWPDMKEILPLLAQRTHAATLLHGFARGGEALAFAENVRIFYDILKKYEGTSPVSGTSLWQRLTR